MALSPGTRLGSYEVVSTVGVGGMGEVYRAHDHRLNRDVALKVLPEAFASDPDRLARFEREAQTLAGLNHPNIAHLHGIEEGGAVRALVMELVEGEDLRQRLERGAIPVGEALTMARQVAEALEAAHERGVVHRDLKPANIKVDPEGRVKVLDFGLAKALEPSAVSQVDAMNSPTLTVPATAMGMVLGTAAYMAPEQAKGKTVDRRADVWAFGVVLFEMLTGRRAFDGADTSDVFVSVLRDSPPLEALPPATPPSIHRLLRRSLAKDRSKRLDSMTAARLEIEDALAHHAGTPTSDTNTPARTRRTFPAAGLIVGSVAVLALAGAGLYVLAGKRAASSRIRIEATTGFEGMLAADLNGAVALSRDGQAIVFAGVTAVDQRPQLYYRRLDQLRATAIPGTQDADDPFFSPDGRWIGFFANAQLKKVPVAGGAVVALADATASRGATWGEDDVITFTPEARPGVKLLRIAAAGGTPSELGELPQGHVTQRWPQALPGNRAILYTGFSTTDTFEDACAVIHPLTGLPPRVVQCGGHGWRYAESGHLLYVHSGTLFAVPFDLGSASVTGDAVPVIEHVLSFATSGVANFDVASNGLIAYIPGSGTDDAVPLDVIDREGRAARLPLPPQAWKSLAYSPDGRQLAIEVAASTQSDIWVYDIARNALTRLTFSNVPDGGPVWTPDGRRVTYHSAQNGPPNLFWKPADGSGEEERLLKSDAVQVPTSWDPSGRQLMMLEKAKSADYDVAILSVEREPGSGLKSSGHKKLVATPANEVFGKISPDGRWFAYASDESGALEVYVRAMTGATGRWQVSTGGGAWPAWSLATHELVYGTISGAIMAVTYEERPDRFVVGRPARWSPQEVVLRSTAPPYTLHPDGKHIVATALSNRPDLMPRSFVLVTNFFDELRGAAKAR